MKKLQQSLLLRFKKPEDGSTENSSMMEFKPQMKGIDEEAKDDEKRKEKDKMVFKMNSALGIEMRTKVRNEKK